MSFTLILLFVLFAEWTFNTKIAISTSWRWSSCSSQRTWTPTTRPYQRSLFSTERCNSVVRRWKGTVRSLPLFFKYFLSLEFTFIMSHFFLVFEKAGFFLQILNIKKHWYNFGMLNSTLSFSITFLFLVIVLTTTLSSHLSPNYSYIFVSASISLGYIRLWIIKRKKMFFCLQLFICKWKKP